jgi:hypothetical protein
MAGRHPVKSIPVLYAAIMPEIVEIAKKCGYAVCAHGSMSHDLDLVAVPWVHNALPQEDLIERIREYVGGYIDDKGTTAMAPSPEKKVHGRTGWCIFFNPRFTGPYIDISVTPRIDWETQKVIGS